MAGAQGYFPGRAPIDAYGNGGFRFAGMSHKGSIVCLPGGIGAWPPLSADAIGSGDVAVIISGAEGSTHLLLGTGKTLVMPPAWVRPALEQAGLWLEVMDTGAAARTYNILLGEGRPVAAALIAVA